MLKKSFTVFMACAMINLSMFAATPLERGKGLSVRITSAISSKNIKTAKASAIVDNDVKAPDGTVLIKRGTPVEMQLNGKKAKGCGRAGYIEAVCVSTTSTDGQTILLNGSTNAEGDNKKGLSIGLGVGSALTFLPTIGLVLLAIKGKNATIPANTVIPTAFVANDYMIEK